VPPGWDIPVNAIVFTLFFASLLLLINIGSTIAFNILMSIASVAIFTSYIICISCVLRKRFLREPLLPSRFSLGRAGIAVNVIALCFLSLIWVLLFFPTMPNPSLVDMNWTCAIYGIVVTFALVYYHFYGKHSYDGPVEYVKKLD
jgi:amino acid transporter